MIFALRPILLTAHPRGHGDPVFAENSNLGLDSRLRGNERMTADEILLRTDPRDTGETLQALPGRRDARRRQACDRPCRQSGRDARPQHTGLAGLAVALAESETHAAAVARTDRGR